MAKLTEITPENAHLFRRPLSDGGGGGTSGGMELEPRVARLEANVDHIQRDVTDLKADMRTVQADISTLKADLRALTVTVGHLPTKEWIGTNIRNWLALAVGLATLANIGATWLLRSQGH